jgi:glycerol-3-phosphate dehydrogenase
MLLLLHARVFILSLRKIAGESSLASPNNLKKSARDLEVLSKQEFDVAIIGGGITGAWLALHASSMGYATVLLERGDFASETSSASSKLLHGGIRYLQQFHFNKVRESALERAEYINASPHLSHSVPFIVPTYSDIKRSKAFLQCGMIAYQALCVGQNKIIGNAREQLPSSYTVSRSQLNEICDLGDSQHNGGVVFYERHMFDSERMVWSILNTAKQQAAQVFNHVNVSALLGENGRVNGLQARDEIGGADLTIASKLVINAAGPYVDGVNQLLGNTPIPPRINAFAVGSHIITRKISDHAIALTTKQKSDAKLDRGGRHVFVIPWRGYSLIGTSYHEVERPDKVSLQSEHVQQLLDAVNENMPAVNLSRQDVISGYSGLYPLQTEEVRAKVYQGTGEYQIIDHAGEHGVEGLVTALGAKFTTGRKVSELTMDLVNQKLGSRQALTSSKLFDADYADFTDFNAQKVQQYSNQFPATLVTHLARLYGSQIDQVIDHIKSNKDYSNQIISSQPDVLGQVSWAVEHEMAQTITDVLYGRTSLGLLGITAKELEPIADLMSSKLGWDEQTRRQQIEQVVERLNQVASAIEGV